MLYQLDFSNFGDNIDATDTVKQKRNDSTQNNLAKMIPYQ